MFEKLARKLDGASCKMILGRTLEQHAWQLQKADPGLSKAEAEERAKEEILASMRSEALDINSYAEVSAWSRRFLRAAAGE